MSAVATVPVVKERPILFSGEMVRAILDGRKTQTRRVAKFVPYKDGINLQASSLTVGDYCTGNPELGKVLYSMGGGCWQQRTKPLHCPYGQPGDRLWVRESFQPLHTPDMYPNWETGRGYDISYPATEGRREYQDWNTDSMTDKLTPGIYMPRWASRITLEVTAVRVERVQQIIEADAIAEGCSAQEVTAEDLADLQISDSSPNIKELGKALGVGQFTAKFQFGMIWDLINAKRGYSFHSNPWVWVIEFQRAA